MKADLWVIWLALLIAVGFTAFEFGGFFPARNLIKQARQEGWEAGFDRGCPHGIPRDDTADLDALLGDLADDADGRWHDTVEHMTELARPYYETPAGDAGQSSPDSPRPDFPLPAERPDYPFPPSPIYDELAANGGWLRGCPSNLPPGLTCRDSHCPVHGPPAPVVPSAGAGPEPPAPVLAPGPDGLLSGRHDPGARPDETLRPESSAGPGADPWQEIAAGLAEDPDLNEWSIRAERARCAEIIRELRDLGKTLSEPWKLTPWKGATA